MRVHVPKHLSSRGLLLLGHVVIDAKGIIN
jgi:hypothetical protein